ncbi:cadmium-translocating P-type ATPase [Saccharibacillus sp. VR-M41]|uniref:Cadmium-translocating P-type ATPase n=2 Tax=Saccharibacillus alkalitolerans TaxID=2705290 RepID=A0ABX0FA84_9BACL|nr:cadmium-translocating P-type ATPase [Saccharibacillus alkalitolerans]
MQTIGSRNLTGKRTGADSGPKFFGKKKREKGASLRELAAHSEVQKALGSGLLMLAAWGMAHAGIEAAAAVLYVFSYGLGGWGKARDAVRKLKNERELDVNLLMVAAALGAAAIGYWNEGALLIFIFALSGALESFASDRSGRDISELIAMRPERALKIEAGTVRKVEANELRIGDRVLVPPGEIIPADGCVIGGRSSVDQSSITGESVPVDRSLGDGVYTGTVNGEGELRIEVTQDAADTLFAKMIRMVEQAREDSPPSQRFVERFEAVYVKAVLVAASLLIALGPWLWDGSWQTAFYKGMVFLVVASPCAIVASIMPPVLSAMSGAARRGVLFKGGACVDRLAGVRVVAFDKTGTLTQGRPELVEFITAPGVEENEVLRFAASVERYSSHPLAQAVVRAAESRGLSLPQAERPSERPGFGAEAFIGNERWGVGRLPYSMESGKAGEGAAAEKAEKGIRRFAAETARSEDMPRNDSAWWEPERERLRAEGRTVSFVRREGEAVALLALSDRVRPEAREAVDQLRGLGIESVMLTGDGTGAAAHMARAAGIEQVFAGLLPEDKVGRIQELRRRYGPVLMVGDGVNDAPAMAAADVSMAMGIRGSGAALGTADIVLMRDEVRAAAGAVRLARRAERVIRQNLAFATAVILLLIASSLSLGIALPLGVVGHEGSTLLVLLNGLRLLRSKKSFH